MRHVENPNGLSVPQILSDSFYVAPEDWEAFVKEDSEGIELWAQINDLPRESLIVSLEEAKPHICYANPMILDETKPDKP